MKLASYNINGVNGRLAHLLDWLAEAQPDVVCLQELKAPDARFPHAALREAGYHAAWKGQPANHGVAILARGKEPLVTRRALPGDDADTQSRYLEAAIDGILVGCIYAPNGNPHPGPRFDYKLAWLDRLHAHAASLLAANVPVALIGDFNVVPTDADIYDPASSWRKDALTQPAPREAFQRLLAQGWLDAVRALHPDAPRFTFWDYKRLAWQRDAGLRIDHFLLSPQLAKRLHSADVDRDRRGLEGASDHAPVWITLREARRKRVTRS
jgi:exodeoxyribonuclease-3